MNCGNLVGVYDELADMVSKCERSGWSFTGIDFPRWHDPMPPGHVSAEKSESERALT